MKKILLLFVMLFQICFAQDGHIDLTFNSGDRGGGYGDGPGSGVSVLLPDGKILRNTNGVYNGNYVKRLIRLNSDGENDLTYNADNTGPMFGNVAAIVLLPDGKVVIAGTFTNYNGIAINGIARIYPDGTLDQTFNPGAGTNDVINTLTYLPNGKIVIAGDFTTYNGTMRNRIAVLNSDGSPDLSFNPNSGANAAVTQMSVQADGKILIVGNFTYYNVTPVSRFARINSDGSIDNTFVPDFGLTHIKILPDGKILGLRNGSVYRLNTTGTLDNTFNYVYVGSDYTSINFCMLPDGKFITGVLFKNGTPETTDDIMRFVRLNPDGSSDSSYYFGPGSSQYTSNSSLSRLIAQPDGSLLVFGSFGVYNGKVVHGMMRLDSNGVYDPNFNGGGGADFEITNMWLMPDDKLIINGLFTEYNDVPCYITRLNADGTLDTVFPIQRNLSSQTANVYSIASQQDGKVIMGGNFLLSGNVTNSFVKRFNTDGTVDTSFNFTYSTAEVQCVVIRSDGKILVAGYFPSPFPFPATYKVLRLNIDGSVDTTFDVNSVANGIISKITIQPDGKLLLSGSFTTYKSLPAAKMIRLDPNGVIDPSFSVSGFTNAPGNVTLQPDGKILATGENTSFIGGARKMVRLNSNGSIDQSFDIGSGPANYDSIYSIALQADGKVLVGGPFLMFNGQSKSFMVRLNNDGSLDNSFNTVGYGPDYFVRKIVIQSVGKPVIAGSFIRYNGIGRNRIARLNPIVLSTDEFDGLSQSVIAYPNPVKDVLHLEHRTTIQNVTIYDLLGKVVMNKKINAIQSELDMSGLGSALYFVKVETADGIQNVKVIKE